MDNPQLLELVNAPRERPDAEYKSWLDLSDRKVRANLARHLCALSNNGGGFLVFGMSETDEGLRSAGAKPGGLPPYDQDELSGIVTRFLVPAFQVAVHHVTSGITGIAHPVVWVPSHQAVPVCSKADGPHDDNGRPVGIRQGFHYTREPKPASVPVTTPELWRPIIHRCVLHQREALLAGLAPFLRSPEGPAPQADEVLRLWHDAVHARFLEAVAGFPDAGQLPRAHYQLSYCIETADGQALGETDFRDRLRTMNREVTDLVDTGWSMFEILVRRERRPRWTSDAHLGRAVLQCDFLDKNPARFAQPEFWRVSPTGMATIVRGYFEDGAIDLGQAVPSGPGTWFWPFAMARDIAELLRHARAFAVRLEASATATFRVQWSGLQGRTLADPNNPLLLLRSQHARDDSWVATATSPAAELTERWPDLTAELLSSVMRMFDPGQVVTAQDIRSWSGGFRP